MKTQFDRGYYQKYYLDSRTAAVSAEEMRALALLIAAYCDHVGLPVKRILDAGCGIVLLRAPLLRALPAVSEGTMAKLSALLSLPSGYHRDLQASKAPTLRAFMRSLEGLGLVPALIGRIEFDAARMRAARSSRRSNRWGSKWKPRTTRWRMGSTRSTSGTPTH